jgi:glycine oxidase
MPAKGESRQAMMDADVIVVGGGVIGTAIAWRAAAGGRSVTLIDPDTDDKASLVAAGMLGPVSESVFGEQDLLALNLHAVDRFPAFNAELEAVSGLQTGLRTEGTLAVAYDSGDLAALDRLTEFRHSIGLKAERLDARACRRLEPFLAPSTRGGVLATGDLSVDNRRYLAALRTAAAAAGVRTVVGHVTDVAAGRVRFRVSPSGARPSGVAWSPAAVPPSEVASWPAGPDRAGPWPPGPIPRPDRPDASGAGETVATGETVEMCAGHVVVAAGWGTGRIGGVPDEIRKAIRPVKGQILRLRHPGNLPHIISHTVRAMVQGRDIYLVPRADGELVVGATQEERDDRDITAGAVHDLLRDAMTAVPAISELILAEASAGRRPGTSDNGPILGPVTPAGPLTPAGPQTPAGPAVRPGLIIAAGHFRNGVLLSAATADAVAALLAGAEPHQAWTPFYPGRLT